MENYTTNMPEMIDSENATTEVPDNDSDMGSKYKIMAMVVLGVGSIIAALLPRLISQRHRRENFLISLMLCFGGGVLLATSLVHILADVRKDMPQNAEVYMCIGFFAIYIIDELIHFFFGEPLQHMSGGHSENDTNHHLNDPHNHVHYGAANTSDNETEFLLNNGSKVIKNFNSIIQHQAGEPCDAEEGNARICYTTHEEPCAEPGTGALGLVTALSIHSVIEGLAIGLQYTSTGVMVLFLAVACHKYVMGFCVGLEIQMGSNTSLTKYLIAVIIFSLGSVVGIGIGMTLDDIPPEISKTAFPILQALAGGTLLYVAVCEVLPRERARWHLNPVKRYAGIVQFISVCIGFAAMTIAEHYLEHNN